jgi:hypothetical protein
MRVILLLAALVIASGASGVPLQNVYANARYGYSISYPPGLLKQQPEPDAGDGVVFSAVKGPAEFRVYASGTAAGIDDTPEAAGKSAEEKCPGHRATYRVAKHRLAAISCTIGTNILYSKTLLRNGMATTFVGSYPVKERPTWDPVVAAMARSMTAGHFLK